MEKLKLGVIGLWWRKRPAGTGWDVSCDARLFAGEYPDMPVITSGAGKLHFAHADNEQIFLPDLFKSIVFNALFLLRETGSI